MSSGRSTGANANPLEAIAYEIVDDMTQYKLASNPVEYYLKVNKLGHGYEQNIVMPRPPPQPEESVRTRGVGRGRGRNARELVRPWASALSEYEQQLRVDHYDHLREERVRYILGIVTGLLVRKGHMSSAQSYRLNTARMRERIGVMVDEITSPQPPESESDEADNDNEYAASQKNRVSRFIERVSSASASTKFPDSIVTLGPEPSSPRFQAPTPGPSHMQLQTQRAQARFRIDGRAPPLPKAAVSFTTKLLLDKMKLMTAPDRFGKIPNFMEQTVRRRVEDLPERFQKKVNLPGFGDEDITFHMTDQHLTIKALSPKSESPKSPVAHHKESYFFEETIEIPPGLGLANLAITRQKDGSLLIEEAPPNLNALVRERRHYRDADAGAGGGHTNGKSII